VAKRKLGMGEIREWPPLEKGAGPRPEKHFSDERRERGEESGRGVEKKDVLPGGSNIQGGADFGEGGRQNRRPKKYW